MKFNTDYSATTTDYYLVETVKQGITLHYTAGSTASGAISTLCQQDMVCVPFVVDKDGTVYQLFNPKYYAFHLGIRGAAEGYKKGHFDKKFLSVEIVNEGPLKKVGSDYLWWPKNWGAKYTGKVVNYSFRGFDYHAAFPEVQIQAVCELIKHLCTEFNISKSLVPKDKRELLDLDYMDTFEGICSHVNFRWDKWDIPGEPVFPWDRLQKYLEDK